MPARMISGKEKGEAAIATLLLHIMVAGIPKPEQEYRFHPERRWRFDLCWEFPRIAVEIDGGNRMATIGKNGKAVAIGRHTQDADYEKLNEAGVLGYRVFRFTHTQVKSGYAINVLERIWREITI